ncbi:hypothetical protein ES708_29069 [subsurface metagenome]
MKFTVVKIITVTTKELYKVEIAGYLDPLSYMNSAKPLSTKTEREVKFDIFREGEQN